MRAGIELLHGFRHHMRRVVTDQRQRLLVFPGEDADLGVGPDRLGEVLELAIERHRHGLLGERLGDRFRDLASRDARLELAMRTVGEGH